MTDVVSIRDPADKGTIRDVKIAPLHSDDIVPWPSDLIEYLIQIVTSKHDAGLCHCARTWPLDIDSQTVIAPGLGEYLQNSPICRKRIFTSRQKCRIRPLQNLIYFGKKDYTNYVVEYDLLSNRQ